MAASTTDTIVAGFTITALYLKANLNKWAECETNLNSEIQCNTVDSSNHMAVSTIRE